MIETGELIIADDGSAMICMGLITQIDFEVVVGRRSRGREEGDDVDIDFAYLGLGLAQICLARAGPRKISPPLQNLSSPLNVSIQNRNTWESTSVIPRIKREKPNPLILKLHRGA